MKSVTRYSRVALDINAHFLRKVFKKNRNEL